jgi:hypothetical protein
MRWLAAHRGGLAVTVLAAVAGLLVGLAVAAGGTKSKATTQTVIAGRTSTVVQTRTITRPARVVVHTVTQAASGPGGRSGSPPAAGAAPVPAPAAGQNNGGRVAKQQFAGDGPRNLGNITVASPATLRWTSSGKRFRLLFDGGAQAVDTASHAGQTFVPAGTYSQVSVQADGNWTIRIG